MSDLKPGTVIAVDFDGVLNAYIARGLPLKNTPEAGALDFVNHLINDLQAKVVVHTCRGRSAPGRQAVANWLKENEFPFMRVTGEKQPALAYVSDNAVVHERGVKDWDDVLADILDLASLER